MDNGISNDDLGDSQNKVSYLFFIESQTENFKNILKNEMNKFVKDFCKELEEKLQAMAFQHKEQLRQLISNRERKLKAENEADRSKPCSLPESPVNSASATKRAQFDVFCHYAAKYIQNTSTA